ncbi:MAG: hypothetical protein ACI35P_03040 [Bacillus sp. (in: firmicutes)]
MDAVISVFGSVFGFLDNSVLGIPLIAWVVIPVVIGVIGNFVRGRK